MAPAARLCLALLGLCAAAASPAGPAPCPPPCDCRPRSVSCRGCPGSYLTLGSADLLHVQGCRDIQYLLRLHQPGQLRARLTLRNVEIVDSFIAKIPETYLNNEYKIETLILKNNSISTIDVGLEAKELTLLDLSHNNISFIENRTFERMQKLLYLDLSANRIENASLRCFSGLGQLLHLDLSANNLSSLDDTVFLPLSSLQQLNLSSNRLQVLSERCFSSLLLLQQLDISYNRLTSVAPGALQFLPNLARLLLADNPQLRPDAHIFVGSGRRLQQVDASRTGLSQVPEALTHSVLYLSLAGNRIPAVRCGDLDSYPLLHMLDFSDNILGFIEDDALGRLEMLAQLYLNKNRLRSVPKMLPDKLSFLSMDNNLIVNLTIADFTTLTGLKILLLSNNLISYIQENVFYQLVSLEVLDLSSNPLKALTPNTFSGPVSLKDLRIAFVNISPPAKDISFPVPYPEGIESLQLQYSPGLTRELLADTAALAAMGHLQTLDVRFSNISSLRSDLLHFLPQLKVLRLEGNKLNCSDLNWLADWMRENLTNNYRDVKCFSPPRLQGKSVAELPTAIIENTTTEKHFNVTTTLPSIVVNDTNDLNKISPPNVNKDAIAPKKNVHTTTEGSDENDHSNHAEIHNNELSHGDADLKTHPIVNITDQTEMAADTADNATQPYKAKNQLRGSTQDTNDSNKEKEKIDLSAKNKKPSIDIEKYGKKNYNKDLSDKLRNKFIPYVEAATLLSPKNMTAVSSARKKLLEIFSDISRRPDNQSNATSAGRGAGRAAPLCSAAENSNGTENKTNCSLHPAAAPAPGGKPERFIYRKTGGDKSGESARAKKSKSAAPARLDAGDRNATRPPFEAKNLFSQKAQPINLAILRNDDADVRSVESTKRADTVVKSVTSGQRINSPKITDKIIPTMATSAEAEAKVVEEFRNATADAVGNASRSDEAELRRNGSQYEMSGFRAEAGGGDALGALLALGAVAGLVLAGACMAQRHPRAHNRDVMEVPTIAAVGGLW